MKLAMSMACIQYKLSPEEAINAVTINTAYAMKQHAVVGTITPGKKANLIITKKISSYGFIPYAFGSDVIDTVLINGKVFNKN